MDSDSIPLFAYGTLLDPKVQLRVFGHELWGESDELQGYVLRQNSVAGCYPDIVPNSDSECEVSGRCFYITPYELELADAYETELYFRKWVTLNSGKRAWVYLAANNGINNEI